MLIIQLSAALTEYENEGSAVHKQHVLTSLNFPCMESREKKETQH